MNRQAALRAFDAEVEAWIGAALADGPCSFIDLLSRLPGVYPCTVLQPVGRMQEQGRLDARLVVALQRDAATFQPSVVASPGILPAAHPLDFEWRFAADTANKILSVAQTLAKPDDPILLFGTPVVAAAATTAGLDRADLFVGEDNVVTRSIVALNKLADEPLQINVITTRQPIPGRAGVVVVDPPWYFDFMRPMLAAAASACRVGGHVLVSLLPAGTRPGAGRDRERLLAYLRRFTLHAVETLAGALTYEMPFFETNALAAAGIRGVPPHWRRSDLVVLQKVGEQGALLTLTPREKSWHDVSVGRMRLFIARESSVSLTGDAFQSIVAGDVLPTVSRRDSRRRKAQVWTSGNRIFRSARPDLVLAAAQQAANHRVTPTRAGPPTHVERDEVARLRYVLRNLAAREEAEQHSALEGAPCLTGLSASGPTKLSATSPTTVSG